MEKLPPLIHSRVVYQDDKPAGGLERFLHIQLDDSAGLVLECEDGLFRRTDLSPLNKTQRFLQVLKLIGLIALNIITFILFIVREINRSKLKFSTKITSHLSPLTNTPSMQTPPPKSSPQILEQKATAPKLFKEKMQQNLTNLQLVLGKWIPHLGFSDIPEKLGLQVLGTKVVAQLKEEAERNKKTYVDIEFIGSHAPHDPVEYNEKTTMQDLKGKIKGYLPSFHYFCIGAITDEISDYQYIEPTKTVAEVKRDFEQLYPEIKFKLRLRARTFTTNKAMVVYLQKISARKLSFKQIERIFNLYDRLSDPNDKVNVIERLAWQLTDEDHLSRALESAASIRDEYLISKLLTALSSSLSSDADIDFVLNTISPMVFDCHKSRVLCAIIPQLTSDTHITRVFQITDSFDSSSSRFATTVVLLKKITSEPQLLRVIEIASTIRDMDYRNRAFDLLLPKIKALPLPRVFEILKGCTSDCFKSEALKSIAPSLSSDADRESTLAAIASLSNDLNKLHSLKAIIPQLTSTRHLDSALEILESFVSFYCIRETLLALSPKLKSIDHKARAKKMVDKFNTYY